MCLLFEKHTCRQKQDARQACKLVLRQAGKHTHLGSLVVVAFFRFGVVAGALHHHARMHTVTLTHAYCDIHTLTQLWQRAAWLCARVRCLESVVVVVCEQPGIGNSCVARVGCRCALGFPAHTCTMNFNDSDRPSQCQGYRKESHDCKSVLYTLVSQVLSIVVGWSLVFASAATASVVVCYTGSTTIRASTSGAVWVWEDKSVTDLMVKRPTPCKPRTHWICTFQSCGVAFFLPRFTVLYSFALRRLARVLLYVLVIPPGVSAYTTTNE